MCLDGSSNTLIVLMKRCAFGWKAETCPVIIPPWLVGLSLVAALSLVATVFGRRKLWQIWSNRMVCPLAAVPSIASRCFSLPIALALHSELVSRDSPARGPGRHTKMTRQALARDAAGCRDHNAATCAFPRGDVTHNR